MLKRDRINDFDAFMAEIRRRSDAILRNPPVVWVNTSPARVEQYLESLTRCEGLSNGEIDEIESTLGVKLPQSYLAYLRSFGRVRGQLLRGSDLPAPSEYLEFRTRACDLVRAAGAPSRVNASSVIFLIHQGYSFDYFAAGDDPDPQVRRFDGGRDFLYSATFTDYLCKDVSFAENNAFEERIRGGNYASIGDDGRYDELHMGRCRPLRRYGAGTFISHPLGLRGAVDDEPPDVPMVEGEF